MRLQPMQRRPLFVLGPNSTAARKLPLPTTPPEGEQYRGGRRDAPSNAYHPGTLVGRHAHHGHVI
jgi:hypothetical protein